MSAAPILNGRLPTHRIRPRLDIQLDLMPVGIAHAEAAGRLAEGGETRCFHRAARLREDLQRGADVEGDVIKAGHAFGLRTGTGGARELARDVVMVDAGGEEDDAAVLGGARLAQAEEVAIEAARGVEIAHEEGDVA